MGQVWDGATALRLAAADLVGMLQKERPLDSYAYYEQGSCLDPVFYFDTSVIRDITEDRCAYSTRLSAIAKEKGWKCYTSIFALMEWIDNKQDDEYVEQEREKREEYNKICRQRGQKILNTDRLVAVERVFKDAVSEHAHVELIVPSTNIWNIALDITLLSTISSPDALHLATALESQCTFLATTDSPLIKECKRLSKIGKMPSQLLVADTQLINTKLKNGDLI